MDQQIRSILAKREAQDKKMKARNEFLAKVEQEERARVRAMQADAQRRRASVTSAMRLMVGGV